MLSRDHIAHLLLSLLFIALASCARSDRNALGRDSALPSSSPGSTKEMNSPGNSPAKFKLRQVEGRSGSKTALMVALSVPEGSIVDRTLVAKVVKDFTIVRMTAPPDTSLLLITIVGPTPASSFAELWRASVRDDQVAAAFMARMETADVLQGTPSGQVLSEASLLQ